MPDATAKNALIVRSVAPPATSYLEYQALIRYDFWYSCAYCTITECEAHAIAFTIDHYEPRSAEPALANEYSNLMYCCQTCNNRKSDRHPPATARADGHRFFRPDQDDYNAHFVLSGQLLSGQTNTGRYTIEAVDLNRGTLRRLRELRERAKNADSAIQADLAALLTARIDGLPANVRGWAYTLRTRLVESNKKFEGNFEQFLRQQAASPFIGSEDDKRTKSQRAGYLDDLKAMYPDTWSGRKKAKK